MREGAHACAWCHDTEASLSWIVDASGRPPLPRPPAGDDLEASLDERGNARLRYRVDKLCFSCHVRLDPKAEANRGMWLHGPFRAGLCLGCHEPHEPSAPSLLISQSWRELCVRCHTSYHGGRKETAYRQECSDCHAPHMRRKAYPGPAPRR